MAPSDKEISSVIRATVRSMFNGPDRENLTVNNIREQVETNLHLTNGFLKQGSWKQESKNIVKAESGKLLDLEEAGIAPASTHSTSSKVKSAPDSTVGSETIKKGIKRSPNGNEFQARKRQKKEARPISEEDGEDSALTPIEDIPEEIEDYNKSDGPGPKKPAKSTIKSVAKSPEKQTVVNRKKEKKVKDAVEESDATPEPKSSKTSYAKKKSGGKDVEAPIKKSIEVSGGDKGDPTGLVMAEVADQSDSEMSIVLDEPPRRKKKSNSSSNAQSLASNIKSSKPTRATKSHPDLSPDETEIKMLQSQLTMCGVRKVWGVILKDYGSDKKAKIRHLKRMLKDVGMEGRFSKQKAEEIKEARELQADLEAVKEGDAIWGMGRGARNKKGVGENKTSELTDDDVDEFASRSRSISEKPPARVARAKMDLAFLGDESDSDE